MDLGELLAGLVADGAGGYAVEPPADWRQGRTLYGGLSAALCLQAARLGLADPPAPLRALQLAFVGPAAGRVRFTPTVLRRGRAVTFVAVDAATAEGVCTRALLTFGLPRESDVVHDRAPAPDVPAPEECPVLDHGGAGAATPAFIGHLELRAAGEGALYSGGDPELLLWVRHRDAAGVDPTLALVAIADALPPAAAVAYRGPRPVSSVTWSLDLAEPAPRTDWYLLRSSSERAAEGYSLQTMGCWDRDGRLLALGRQTVAVF